MNLLINKLTRLCWMNGLRSDAEVLGSPRRQLMFKAPQTVNGRNALKPPEEVMDKGIEKWSTSLVGQVFG